MKDYKDYLYFIDTVGGWLTHEEQTALLSAAQDAWNSNCLFFELGALVGKSTIIIGSVIAVNGGGTFVSVDPHEGGLSYPGSVNNGLIDGNIQYTEEPTWNKFCDNVEQAGLMEFVVPLVCKSTEVELKYPIDFLFIDALHDEVNVRADWNHFQDYLKPNAIVAWHDYGAWQGVTNVVNDLIERGIITKLYQGGSLIVTKYIGKK